MYFYILFLRELQVNVNMVKEDPIDIWNISIRKSDESIKYFGERDGHNIPYEEVRKEIERGQDYILHDEDGNSSKLLVNSDGIISTNPDDSTLNNLRGATNLKVNVLEDE